MIRINQIKLPINHTKEQLVKKINHILYKAKVKEYSIWKRSIDARKKPNLFYVYSVDVEVENEETYMKLHPNKQCQLIKKKQYHLPKKKKEYIHPPVVVGMGPAGLFAGLLLVKAGYQPIIIERGEDVIQRKKTVEKFWETGELNLESNVQFGEGGAGTFSDGKLNTVVKDKFGRNRFVLETFVAYGAPEEILYESKPHIGTDVLSHVVSNMRNDMIALGATVRFSSKITDIKVENEAIVGLEVNHNEWIPCEAVILALGHSARDTFSMLYQHKLSMSAKAFAIGVRVEHKREMIDESQYGKGYEKYHLAAAPYKLTHHAKNGRSVYSFCMCPGGFVVNSSSEENCLTVNGMSYHNRDGKNSNSAIIVNVTPNDFSSTHPLAGIEFQRKWEAKAYQLGGGKIPIQRYGDFKKNQVSKDYGTITPNTKGETTFSNLNDCLPQFVCEALVDGMEEFDKKIKGFRQDDTLLSGIEARTSSPLRIQRDETFQSNIKGVYPCGEGAGYAGGITSAAMDGMKVAEALMGL